ncbi:MAG: sugar kinase [Christensenella sp.]
MESTNYGFDKCNVGAIVALGELLVDFVPSRADMRLNEQGEIIKTASGSAGIFACAAANFAGESGFLGQLGRDSLSQMVSKVVSGQNVNLSHAVTSDEGQIGLAFIEYLPTGRNYQYYRDGSVGSKYSAEMVDTAYLSSAFALHYPGMLLELSESMRSACSLAVKTARENNVLVSFDPNIRKELMCSQKARERLNDALETSDIIAPTLDEGRYITGKNSIGDVLRALHAMGPRVIALTRDKDGAVLSANGKVVFAGGIDVQAIDPTGAGDTFAAALVYCVQKDYSLERTAVFCNSAGTLVTIKRGAIGLALPTLSEIEALMQTNPCTIESYSLSEI